MIDGGKSYGNSLSPLGAPEKMALACAKNQPKGNRGFKRKRDTSSQDVPTGTVGDLFKE